MRIIRKETFREGRWRNGMGVSWDIASDPPGTEDFGWRFAIARIAGDVPFSIYPGIDRSFTLIDGEGLALDFGGRDTLQVAEKFVAHFYPCDVPAFCRLRHGACRALNLFLKRGVWRAEVEIVSGVVPVEPGGPMLLFALDGPADVAGERLEANDAVYADHPVHVDSGSSKLYLARLMSG